MKHIVMVVMILVLNFKEKTWLNIPKYYKGVFYATVCNGLYYHLCKRFLVWEFKPDGIDWRILRGLHMFVVTPLLVLLCLSKFPKSFTQQILHIIKWVFGSSLFEYILAKRNMISFKHGWNIFWSGLLYLKMYLYSFLFIKRPLFTTVLSLCSVVYFIKRFNVPLSKRLLKGPMFFLFRKKQFN